MIVAVSSTPSDAANAAKFPSEYIDKVLTNANNLTNQEQSNEINLGGPYHMGNLGTLHRTGDCNLAYDANRGAATIDGFVGLSDLYIRSDDGRLLSFPDNSFYMNIEMVLVVEPAMKIKDCYSDLTAICNTHGNEYDVGEVEILSKTVATTLGNRIAKAISLIIRATSAYEDLEYEDLEYDDLSDYDIAFLEDLLNGKFCPYHRISSRRLTSVNGELVSIDKELATLSMAANTLVTDAVSRRMTNVKGCLADPFVYALYGHSRRNESHGLGYSNDMGGFVVGI
ncbi:MAG: hypothetical protein LBE98_01395, partial [Puniceicoccales bacterium]|nr:hypothetical protein [Puniceicoccales bacterium]